MYEKTRVIYLGNEMALFCYITLFVGETTCLKQRPWGNAIFASVVAVVFNLSFVARFVLTNLI